MKVVVYFDNGMEGVALTPKQLELVRRGVACLHEEAKDHANDTVDGYNIDLKEAEEALTEIDAIEQLRAVILYREETYNRTPKEA